MKKEEVSLLISMRKLFLLAVKDDECDNTNFGPENSMSIIPLLLGDSESLEKAGK